jgi:hypothetical protein
MMASDADAYRLLEALLWQGQPVCPVCGTIGDHYFLNPRDGRSRATRTGARSERRVWKCRACRNQFTVISGTFLHGTKISVLVWVEVLFRYFLDSTASTPIRFINSTD